MKRLKITYLEGDATRPVGKGYKILPHICNNIGAVWGAGYVLALSARWPEPEEMFRSLTNPYGGLTQFVPVEENIAVINMIAQHGTRSEDNPNPIHYGWLMQALVQLNRVAVSNNASLHMPRIGCGLAGGDWNEVEELLREAIDPSIPVYVYDFK